ncbi:type IV pilus assembly protein PilM [Fimbriimonas ginsengisoli]|uniref:Type IV pilus assembly protein PilM n=1 Tax=Fimbriimonas ginsengisoli Gsoil 348 TaxID=661478 RepID=A0A068NSM4_FIMGI|nr:type IV pilus assembly protein PilM [Fimbriimonas ginsengisoli]AIE85775.1 type IV pilus assembly protein PilM [Fimbriimonas ginsengisoli Gsoil 348]
MAKKLSSVLGVDIGSHQIKICEIRTQGREPIVTALGMIDTPEGAVDHMAIYNPEAVGAALKQVISQCGATVGQAVVTIAGQGAVLVRTVEVPRMNPTELKDHMQWEVNRNVPFAESTIVSDFKPLKDEDPNSAQMDVVMAISPQSAIDSVIECMKKAGRQTVAIDVEPLSMARSLQTSYDDLLGDKTVCMVDIGHKTTSINIYRGEKLIMPRQVPIGGEMFTGALADAYTMPLDEAEAMKRERLDIPESAGLAQSPTLDPFGMADPTQGFSAYNPFSDDPSAAFNPFPADVAPAAPTGGYAAEDFDPMAPVDPYAASETGGQPPVAETAPVVAENPEAARMYQAIAPVLEEFVGEVRRSIEYYRSRGGNVDAVEICGGGAKIRGLAPFLTRSLGVTCDAYDPLRRLNLNMRKVAPAFADEHRQEFAVAVGNGLHIFFE